MADRDGPSISPWDLHQIPRVRERMCLGALLVRGNALPEGESTAASVLEKPVLERGQEKGICNEMLERQFVICNVTIWQKQLGKGQSQLAPSGMPGGRPCISVGLRTRVVR